MQNNVAPKKTISIVTPCFNEELSIHEAYIKVKEVFQGLDNYLYEHIFIDNCSTDKTVEILKEIASTDRNVKIIVNSRNFGVIRSGSHGYLQATGDAIIPIVADLQTPPAMIKDFVKKWEEGYKIVMAVKTESNDSFLLSFVRKSYYKLINKLSDTDLVENFLGFGLFDRTIIEIFREIDDPYPYFRGIVSEIGFKRAIIKYVQPTRKRGITKNNFYSLYDIAMLGITSYSKVPLRVATIAGFSMCILSLFASILYFIYKIIFWENFSLGIAPMVIGFFFVSSMQLFFLGILGEYIGSIQTQVVKRPMVIEEERVNF
jgi:polyisoprenyl-phosphate glycosyltransferase